MSTNNSTPNTGSGHMHHQHGYQNGTSSHQGGASWNARPQQSQQRRRDWLWQERIKCELQVHQLLAREQQLLADLQWIAERRAALQCERPKLALSIVLTGIVGIRQAPGERLYAYTLERLANEEGRIQHDRHWCEAERNRLGNQIATLIIELELLDGMITP